VEYALYYSVASRDTFYLNTPSWILRANTALDETKQRRQRNQHALRSSLDPL